MQYNHLGLFTGDANFLFDTVTGVQMFGAIVNINGVYTPNTSFAGVDGGYQSANGSPGKTIGVAVSGVGTLVFQNGLLTSIST